MAAGPPEEPDKIDLKVEVSDQARVNQIVQIGKQVINQVDQKLFKRLGLEMHLGFVLLALLVVLVLGGVGAILYRLRPAEVNMRVDTGCQLCIAVAGFSVIGDEPEVGREFAAVLSASLNENLAELETDTKLVVWGPRNAGDVSGNTLPEVDASAKEAAERVGADLLVYGIVDASQQPWQVTPRFYISPNYAFEDAAEFIGQAELGKPFDARGDYPAIQQREMNKTATQRGKVLAALTVGLTHYLNSEYDRAEEIFRTALQTAEGWEDEDVKKLINLFLGNSLGEVIEATMQTEKMDQAEAYFNAAIEIDPSYARAYIGLGSLAYLRSQIPAQQTNNLADIDLGWLEKSLVYYNQARDLAVEPDLAHVREKAANAIGLVYITREVINQAAGKATDFSQAEAELKKVIAAYEAQPESKILKELAADAHARLGLIYKKNRLQESLKEYQYAATLSSDPKYKKILETLQATTETP